MASHNENDDVPMVPISDSSSSSGLATTSSTTDGFGSSTVVLGYTGPPQTQRRTPLVQMSDPRSSTRSPEPPFLLLPPPSTGGSSDSVGVSSCQPERYPSFATPEDNNLGKELVIKHSHLFSPSHYNRQAAQYPTSRDTVDSMSHNGLYDDVKRWAKRFADSYQPLILYPDAKVAQNWKKLFAFACLLPIFVDPLFAFFIKVKQEEKCLSIDWPMAYLYVAIRNVTDVLFFVNIVLQFLLAYEASESTVFGYDGQMVKHPIKIVIRYFRESFY